MLWVDVPGRGKKRRKAKYQIWKGQIQAGGSKTASKRIHFADKRTQRNEPGMYRLLATVNGEQIGEREMVLQR